MRCCRAFALAKVEKLRLRASCSAADAMYRSLWLQGQVRSERFGSICIYVPNATNQKSAPGRSAGCAQPSGLLGAWSFRPRLLRRDDVDLAASRFNSSQRTLGRIIHLEGNL